MARSGEMPVVFRPAACEGFGLFIALAGSSRSGKTYTALRMATGIVRAAAGENGRIAAIDTENKRMSHYSKTFRFDVWNMGPPFRPGRFADAAQRAEDGGYHCLVIDSFSLEWMGEGGVLDMHEAYLKRKCGDDEAKRLRNNQAAWAYAKPPHKKMMASFIQRTIPIIFCLRAEKKTKPDKEGKPIDIGWQPLQDARFIYEWDVSFTFHPDAPGEPRYDLPHKVEGVNRHAKGTPDRHPKGTPVGAACAGSPQEGPARRGVPIQRLTQRRAGGPCGPTGAKPRGDGADQ